MEATKYRVVEMAFRVAIAATIKPSNNAQTAYDGGISTASTT